MDNVDKISEKIERDTLISLHECCPSDVKKEQGLELVEVADGIAAISQGDPSILLNRTLGLGIEIPVTVDSLQTILDTYNSRNIANYFIHLYEQSLTDEAKDFLAGDKFIQKRGWMKFRSPTPEKREAKTDLRIEKVGLDKSNDFGKMVCLAFGLVDSSIPVLAGLANDDRWHLFVSYQEDTPAGAGALFVDNGIGWLEWGATDPAFRRRGSQASIMAARLNLAAEMGCKHVFTETGEAVEGDPQHSYKNILKAGFSESILRLNYAPNNA